MSGPASVCLPPANGSRKEQDMDFRDKPEEAAFRKEVREFILAEAPLDKSDFREAWQKGQTWWKKLQ